MIKPKSIDQSEVNFKLLRATRTMFLHMLYHGSLGYTGIMFT